MLISYPRRGIKYPENAMKISVSPMNAKIQKGHTAAVLIPKGGAALYPEQVRDIISKIDMTIFRGDTGETVFIPLNGMPGLILCGLGDPMKIDSETLRNAAAAVVALAKSKSLDALSFFTADYENVNGADTAAAVAEGVILGDYSFTKYKTPDEKNRDKPLEAAVIFSADKNSAAAVAERAIVCANVNLCRDLVNETSDRCNPDFLARYAASVSKKAGIACRVYQKKEIEKMGMGLLIAVNRGAMAPAKLIVMKYQGAGRGDKYIALVGKGLTFDSGGMNLKTSGNIETMRMDMAGAAAVIHAVKCAAELKLKVNLYAVVPATENMLSNNAYRPGDIFRSYTGKTVEIGNTDAEGRLILADALGFTEDKLKPEYIIDAATLTGACVATFGEITAAYLSNDDGLAESIQRCADKTGDRGWRLPFYPEYEDNLKSDIADIVNISTEKNAGTIAGAVFLKNFIKNTKWAHIDIAGTAWYSKPRGYRPKNATGYGVRLLVELVKGFTKK